MNASALRVGLCSPPAIRQAVVTALLLACCLGMPSARAGSQDDHERARRAVQTGQVLPLPAVLERLALEQPGQVMEVELEQDRGRWIYEIKLLKPGGQLVKLKLDALTAAPLRSRPDEGRDGRR